LSLCCVSYVKQLFTSITDRHKDEEGEKTEKEAKEAKED